MSEQKVATPDRNVMWQLMKEQWLEDVRSARPGQPTRMQWKQNPSAPRELPEPPGQSLVSLNDDDDRRAYQRFGTTLLAKVRTRSRRQDCQILDLSLTGARLKLDQSLRNARKIALVMERIGGASGQVVWRKDREVGIAFDPLSRDSLAMLRGFLPRHGRVAA